MQIPLGTGSYESIAKSFSAQRCVNLYAAVARDRALNDTVLYSTPGVVQFANLGDKPSRGAIVMNGVYYVVNDTTLYSIDSAGTKTSLGTISGSVRVSMAHNGEKLCIVVPGGNGYEWNATTTTLTQITDADYRTADTVKFKDGYYIFSATAGDVFFISALNDPLTFGALDFGAAELFPDDIVCVHVTYDEVVVFGEETAELFQNVGGSGFPWQRIPGASYEKGAHSKYSPIQWGGNFYFAGGGHNERTSIYKAAGAEEPQRISTDAIDQEIQKFTATEIAKCFSFTYAIEGFSFIGFTFSSININTRTFIYNVTASDLLNKPVWFEQQTGLTEKAWRANSVDSVYNKILITDNVDGRVGYLDPDVYTEYGSPILREKVTSPIAGGGKSMLMHRLELTADAGQGTISGQGSDPEVMMDYSDDGAHTWSSDLTRSLGKMGEYYRRAIWRRVGRIPAHRVFRFRITDPIKTALIKLEAEITGGN